MAQKIQDGTSSGNKIVMSNQIYRKTGGGYQRKEDLMGSMQYSA